MNSNEPISDKQKIALRRKRIINGTGIRDI